MDTNNRPSGPSPLDLSDLHFASNMASSRTSGPVITTSVIAVTCLLLFLFQKILWLVLPCLLALILFYLLFPVMERMIRAGVSRDLAALLVVGAFVALAIAVLILVVPWIGLRLTDAQAVVERYINGGIVLVQHSITSLESRLGLFAEAHLSQKFSEHLEATSGTLAEHVGPLLVSLAAWTPSFLLVPFLAYFFLKDGRHFKIFLSRAVPNAFFETTLNLLHDIDRAARAYFQGLMRLTLLDTISLGIGLWIIGMPLPFVLSFICAVLAWVPAVGSLLGATLVVLVAATDFPDKPSMAYWTIALFIGVRLLDDFFYMPMTVGRSLRVHPLVTVLMIFIGGAVAGIAGLMLALPVLGIVIVIGETVGVMATNSRLVARYRHEKALRQKQASIDLHLP